MWLTDFEKIHNVMGCRMRRNSLQVFRINFWLNINHINYSSKMDIFVWNANENM